MPLTLEGNCPLERFKSYSHFSGGYDKDPVLLCPNCNFVDWEELNKGFDLENICLCPRGMTMELYKGFLGKYESKTKTEERTKTGFQEFVKKSLVTSK